MAKEKDIKKDFQQLKTNKQFLVILILLFVSAFFWIVISLISSQTNDEVSSELTLLAKPLVPNINKEVLSEIQAKYSYSDEELSSFVIYKILVTRDGKTERVVPLDVSIDDIDPKNTVVSTPKPPGFGSLLQSEVQESENKTNDNNIEASPDINLDKNSPDYIPPTLLNSSL
ncbi:MAG: hypothetical protein H6772_03190 [Pseudomonadales bacterium]|nr:hypothetical protein [Pseudomonadales bacterium]